MTSESCLYITNHKDDQAKKKILSQNIHAENFVQVQLPFTFKKLPLQSEIRVSYYIYIHHKEIDNQ